MNMSKKLRLVMALSSLSLLSACTDVYTLDPAGGGYSGTRTYHYSTYRSYPVYPSVSVQNTQGYRPVPTPSPRIHHDPISVPQSRIHHDPVPSVNPRVHHNPVPGANRRMHHEPIPEANSRIHHDTNMNNAPLITID